MFLNLNYFFGHSPTTKHLRTSTERRFIYHKECRVQVTQLFSYTCSAQRVCIVIICIAQDNDLCITQNFPMSLKNYTHCVGKIEPGFLISGKLFLVWLWSFFREGKVKIIWIKVYITQYFIIHYFCIHWKAMQMYINSLGKGQWRCT